MKNCAAVHRAEYGAPESGKSAREKDGNPSGFEALQKESLEIENQIAEIERNRKVIGQEMQESVERESTLQENIQKAQEALTGFAAGKQNIRRILKKSG